MFHQFYNVFVIVFTFLFRYSLTRDAVRLSTLIPDMVKPSVWSQIKYLCFRSASVHKIPSAAILKQLVRDSATIYRIILLKSGIGGYSEMRN